MKTVSTLQRNALWIALLGCVLIYFPIVGHDLHTDDFARISDNAELSPAYFRQLLFDNKSDGFYRPLNHLTFGLTYHLFGLNPRAYGLFNFGLVLLVVTLLFKIAERLTQDRLFSLLLCITWLANVRAVSSTLTWAVGRTTGLYTVLVLAAVAAILQITRKRVIPWLLVALFCMACALLSKESAIVGAIFILAAALYQLRNARIRIPHVVSLTVGLAGIYVVYFALRGRSLAMDAGSAPEYYRLALSLPLLLSNLVSYLERSVLLSVLVLPLFFILLRRSPQATPVSWRNRAAVTVLCLLGFAVAIAPMALVPSRSNLYVFLPSMFVACALASLCRMSGRWPSATQAARPLIIVLLVLVTASTVAAWQKGIKSHRRHRHTLDWTDTIKQTVGVPPPESITIAYDEDAMTGTRLIPEDFTFLRMALELSDCPVAICVNPPQHNGHVFQLLPAPHSAVGFLTPRGIASAGEIP